MIHETIPLSQDGHVTLTTYLHDDLRLAENEHGRPAVLVLPGGAFAFLSPYEAEPVAITFLQRGYHTFVLRYTVGDDCRYPDVLIEVSAAIKLIRERAAAWHVDPRRIVLMGFSAGACLAGMSATQWNAPEISAALQTSPATIRPDAAVIAYGCWDNAGTIWNDPAFVNPGASQFPKSCPPQLDLIHYMGSHVCPLFLWHNQQDRYVPVRNCLMAAEEMCRLGIPVELHLYTGGQHGMSVANPLCFRDQAEQALAEANPNVQMWVEMCDNWIRQVLPG